MKKAIDDLEKIDESIPNKASSAFIRANRKALRLRGTVLVVRGGALGQLRQNGEFVAIRTLNPPLVVRSGTTIKLSRLTEK